ncbi:hypothetical protein K525DRAFT_283152 [Schizophyllum commune Loenen D]|nr:hypothetical protein K525DRAFT_283152 [Schizophyllum commune Loenen D]
MTVLKSTNFCTKCDHDFACSYVDPPTMDILRSAYVPSTQERAVLEADIATMDATTQAIDAQITAIQARLAGLQQMRQQLAVDKQLKAGLIAPIRRLPFELVASIILLALPNNWNTAVCGTVYLPLLQVNHRLRVTVLAMPRVWHVVCAPILRCSVKSTQRFLQAATCHLDRAGGLPIDLFRSTHSMQDAPAGREADEWLFQHFHRFRRLDWHLYPGRFPSITVSAPMLEDATFCWTTDSHTPRRGQLTMIDAVRLRSLHLKGYLSPSQIHVPWSRLQRLDLHLEQCGPEDVLELGHCQTLETLVISVRRMATWMGDVQASLPTITLHSLRTLSLQNCGIPCARMLTCPNMREMDLDFMMIPRLVQLFFAPFVKNMLFRSSSHPSTHPLEALTIRLVRLQVNHDAILGILDRAFGVRKLSLSVDAAATIEVELLSRTETLPRTLPSLEHLTIRTEAQGVWLLDGLAESLKRFALSRWALTDGPAVARLTLESKMCPQSEYCECAIPSEWRRELEAKGILVNLASCESRQERLFIEVME